MEDNNKLLTQMAEIKKLSDENDFYNLSLKLKSYIFRLRRKKNYTSIQNLIEYSINLIKEKKINENWTSTTLNIIEWSDENMKLSKNDEFDLKFYDNLIILLNRLPFSIKKRQVFDKINKNYFSGNNEIILKILIKDSLSEKDYKYIHKALLHLKYDKIFTKQIFTNYFLDIKKNEKDLLITRFILMKIVIKRVKEAFDIFQDFRQDNFFKESLLCKMLEFLFESLLQKNKEVFEKLMGSCENCMRRDEDIGKCLKMIGSQYFGIQDSGSFNLMSMMGSMFS